MDWNGAECAGYDYYFNTTSPHLGNVAAPARLRTRVYIDPRTRAIALLHHNTLPLPRDAHRYVMPAVMAATLAPRVAVGARAREELTAGGVVNARAREALAAAGAANAQAREALAAAGAGWRRRIRLSLEAQRLRDLRLHPHDLSLFSANQIHLFRVDGRLVGTWPTPRWEWVPAGRGAGAGRPERLGPVGRLDPLQLPAFELPPPYHNSPTHFTHMDLNSVSGGKQAGGGAASGTIGAMTVLGAFAALLTLSALVLLIRALERCLDQRLFKVLRRRSDEWFTPNVLATSHHVREEPSVESASLECPNIPTGDPPPPYSMCLPKNPQVPASAEPPPPYSACYVAFGGPQDPLPRVHLNVPTTNSFQDTGQIAGPTGSRSIQHSDVPVVTGAPPRASDEASDADPPEWRPSRNSVASGGAAIYPNNLVA